MTAPSNVSTGRIFTRIHTCQQLKPCMHAPAALLYTYQRDCVLDAMFLLQVQGRQVTRRAPCPLATLEMCKSGSKWLRLSGGCLQQCRWLRRLGTNKLQHMQSILHVMQ
jgi:hypothetical protein